MYAQASDDAVRPLLKKDYSFIDDLNTDILHVANELKSAATAHIPAKKNKRNNSHNIQDRTLSHLCWKSRRAFCTWKQAGRPRSGALYEERRKCKRDVQHYLNQKRGRIERRRIQQRDEMFSENHPRRFRSGSAGKHVPEKLLVNGNLVSDQEDLISIWASHFEAQGKSQVSSNRCLTEVVLKVRDMECASYEESDEVLDTLFVVEEVKHALKRLKSKRAGGPDNLSPEHLKFAGPVFVNWLHVPSHKQHLRARADTTMLSSRVLSPQPSKAKDVTPC